MRSDLALVANWAALNHPDERLIYPKSGLPDFVFANEYNAMTGYVVKIITGKPAIRDIKRWIHEWIIREIAQLEENNWLGISWIIVLEDYNWYTPFEADEIAEMSSAIHNFAFYGDIGIVFGVMNRRQYFEPIQQFWLRQSAG